MGHQTQIRELLVKERALLSCINTMKDRKGPEVDDERAFALAYLSAYEMLTGYQLGLIPTDLEEGRDGE